MAKTIPYELLMQIVCSANGQNSFTYPVPQGQTLSLDELLFTSTGAFQIVGITDASGVSYTNATSSAGIPSTLFANGANNNNSIRDFKPDLVIEGGNQITVTVKDTSGSGNTVNLLFNGRKDLQ